METAYNSIRQLLLKMIALTLYSPNAKRPNLSHESFFADTAYREVVKQVDELGLALGKDLEKSQELADDWRKHIIALDAYIKSLQGLPWRRILSYSACFLLVGAFIWKMGALRVLPDFLGTAIKLIPTTGMSSTTMQETVAELPKPSVTSTINAITESPVAVFGIVIGVSMGVICLGFMKITILALKRLPK